MIPVTPAPEPAAFDKKVRQPGWRAIHELAAGLAGSRDAIPPGEFPPYWRKVLDELLTSYDRICSYLCLYIPRGAGAPSVDHMLPKSMHWDQVYEWSNYRLACSLMNARKGVADVLDPFEIEEGWFALELVDFQVVPGEGLPPDVASRVSDTIARLRLSDRTCCDARAEYAEDYWAGDVSLAYLARHAPFVMRELQRHGRLRADDPVPPVNE